MNNSVWEKRRKRLFELIEIGSNYDAWCWGYDFFNTFTILLNLTVSIMYTFDNIEMKYGPRLLTLERLTIAFFAIDFLLRVFTAKYLYPDVSEPRAVWKYLISFSGIWRAASTLLTVGYGDILLKTQLGKSIAVLLMIIGIGVIGVITTSITLYIANGGRKMQKSYKEKVIEDIKNKLDNYENLTSEDIEDIIKILKALKK